MPAPDDPVTLRCGPPVWVAREKAWLVTRHADVRLLLRSAGVEVVDIRQGIELLGQRAGRDYPSLASLLGATLFFSNPPFHTHARRFLAKSLALTQEAFEEAALRPLAAASVASMVGKGAVDAASDDCVAFPLAVIRSALGLSRESADAVAAMGRHIVDASHRGMALRALDGLEATARGIEVLVAGDLDRARGEKRGGMFLLSELNRAEFRFSDPELIGLTVFLTWAAVETTSNLLASALHLLAAHPDQAALVRAEPGLVESAVEEVIRLAGPVKRANGRIATGELRLGETSFPAGTPMIAGLAQAQTDPEVYADPHRFDVRRAGPPVIGFGLGAHACLGAVVARREARLFLAELIGAADIRLVEGSARWEEHPDYRRLDRLQLICTPLSNGNA